MFVSAVFNLLCALSKISQKYCVPRIRVFFDIFTKWANIVFFFPTQPDSVRGQDCVVIQTSCHITRLFGSDPSWMNVAFLAFFIQAHLPQSSQTLEPLCETAEFVLVNCLFCGFYCQLLDTTGAFSLSLSSALSSM